eukprot:10630296-Prorocentrum_lima.AAC.1
MSTCTTRWEFAERRTKMVRRLGRVIAQSIGAMPPKLAAHRFSRSAWRRMGGWDKTRSAF